MLFVWHPIHLLFYRADDASSSKECQTSASMITMEITYSFREDGTVINTHIATATETD